MADSVAISLCRKQYYLAIPCSISSTPSRYVSLPVSSLKLPFSPTRRSHVMQCCSLPDSDSAADTHLIAIHEHTDGSLIFRFGNSIEKVENVEGEESKGVVENSGSGGVGDSGLMSGKSGNQEVVEVFDGKENVEKQKNVKSRTRRRKRSKLVEASGFAEGSNNNTVMVKAESDEDRAEEMRTDSSVVSSDHLDEGSMVEKDGLDEFSSSVAVSEVESVVNVEIDIASTVLLKENGGSEETAAHLPTSVVNSEIYVWSAQKGSEEETKAEVQHVTTMVEADTDDTSNEEIVNSYASKDIGREKDEVEAVQMSKVVEDGIIDKRPNATKEGVEAETVQMSMIKDGIIYEKQPNVTNEDVKVGNTQTSKTLEDGIIIGKKQNVTNDDVEVETTQMPKILEDDMVVRKQLVVTSEDLQVEITQMPKTQEDDIAVGKQLDVTNEDAEVESTPMAKTEEDDIVTGGQLNATNEDAEVKTTLMPMTEEEDIVAGKQPTLTNKDTPNVTHQEAKVETAPMPKTEEDDIVARKQPNLTEEDASDATSQDAKVETVPMPKTEEDDIVLEKRPNITNEDVEVETTQKSKTLEDDITVGRDPNVTHEDITEGDAVELLPVLPIKEAEPILDEETTTETLDESSETDNTESLKLVDNGALNLKSEELSIQNYEDTSNNPNLSTLQDKELQSNTDILNRSREQDLAERLVVSSGAALLRHTSEVLAGREDAYFVCDNWLGVADGVSQCVLEGTNIGLYAQELMKNCKKIVTECRSFPITKPDDVLVRSAAETASRGTCTLLVAYFDGQALHVANIGDSGFILIRNGGVYAKSSPMHHEFNFPVHFGSDDDPSKLVERYEIELEEGDVIVTATDGLFDNLYEQEVALMVTKSLQGKLEAEEIAKLLASTAHEVGQSASARSPFADAAQAAGYVGYTGGKPDDITVIVSLVQ